MVATDRVKEIFDDASSAAPCCSGTPGSRRHTGRRRERRGAPPSVPLTHLLLGSHRYESLKVPPRLLLDCAGCQEMTARIRALSLVSRYYTRQGHLHGDCFYCGLCEPLDDTERRIRETADYIQDAEQLAGSVL